MCALFTNVNVERSIEYVLDLANEHWDPDSITMFGLECSRPAPHPRSGVSKFILHIQQQVIPSNIRCIYWMLSEPPLRYDNCT